MLGWDSILHTKLLSSFCSKLNLGCQIHDWRYWTSWLAGTLHKLASKKSWSASHGLVSQLESTATTAQQSAHQQRTSALLRNHCIKGRCTNAYKVDQSVDQSVDVWEGDDVSFQAEQAVNDTMTT